MRENFLNRMYSGRSLSDIQNRASYEFRNATGDSFSNATGSVSEIDPNDRTITFKITLTVTSTSGIARMFGYSKDGQLETYNTANNTVVTVQESSHSEIKTKSLVQPFRVKGIKVKTSSSAAQFDNIFTLYYGSAGGTIVSKKWSPSTYEEPENEQALIIKDDTFQLPINAFTRVETNINSGESLTVIMFIAEEVDPSKVLNNKSVLSVTNASIPSGRSALKVESADVKSYYGRGY